MNFITGISFIKNHKIILLDRDEHNWSFKKWILIRDEKIGKLGLLVIKWPKKGQTIPMRIIKCKILGC